MQLIKNFSLKEYNTFGIDVKAKFFVEANNLHEIERILEDELFIDGKHLLLGGGSNILFTQDFDGMVAKINLKGIKILEEDQEGVVIKVGAGENWDNFVDYCVNRGYGGIEIYL